MNLVERAKNILFTPRTEWEKIAQEPTSVGELYRSYIVPLAAIGPVCAFLGLTLIGVSMPFLGTYRMPFLAGISYAILSFVLGLIGVYVVALIANALAPTFGGEKNQRQALKAAAYAYTPAWIAGVLHLLPMLGLLTLLVSLYGLYLLYLGLPVLMKSPREKAVGYTAVVVVCAIVVSVVIGVLTTALGGMRPPIRMTPPASMRGPAPGSGNAAAALDALKQMSDRMEAANKRMEAAQSSGNQQEQVAAAAEAVGAFLGGGAPVEPVDQALLKAMLPETAVGLQRTRLEAEKSGVAGMKVSKAESAYSDDQGRSLQLAITDMGGVKLLGALAAWALVEQEKETDSGYERMGKVDGRPVHERFDRNGPQSEYGVLVGGRFLVEAHGRKVEMGALKQVVASVDLGKLEAMKADGVKSR